MAHAGCAPAALENACDPVGHGVTRGVTLPAGAARVPPHWQAVYDLHRADVMSRRVLIAAPAWGARKLSEATGHRFSVVTCCAPGKAIALAAVGSYLAVVKTVGFAKLVTEVPILRVSEAVLPYDEYVALARFRTTRDYLIALLLRHRGVVAEAARAGGLMRETLHRLIRRHGIEPDWFREQSP